MNSSASIAHSGSRIPSVDVLRGAVMILMAIDHVRVYSGLPAGGLTAGLFFTRWVTHFCVPVFVFLAGTGAFLYGQQAGSKRLARYLLTRGLLLIALELTVIRFFWTFNFRYADFALAGVIWMLGWCMVLLAAFIRLRPVTIGVIGVMIVSGQQLFALVPRIFPAGLQKPFGQVWEFIYTSGLEGPPGITILYVLVPWIGVMMAGYGFGTILMREPALRRRLCWWIGLSATAIFLLVGGAIVLWQDAPADAPPALFRLLNQQKYPASQLYLLMTLGPAIALLPWMERTKGWLTNVLTTFGRVPMFYYLLHILVIHLAALAVMWLQQGRLLHEQYARAPYVWVEDESARWGLPLLYLVFAIVIVVLYFPCHWYARLKERSKAWWLRYI